MLTWGDLPNFTWDEIGKTGLTWEQLGEISYDDLVLLVNNALDKFKDIPDDTPIPPAAQIHIANAERIFILNDKDGENPHESQIQQNKKWTKPALQILFESFCNNITKPEQLERLLVLIYFVINEIVKKT